MAGQPNQKLKLLYLHKILREQTDDEHPLSAARLSEKLSEYGISAERKSIYSDIHMLLRFGVDVCETRVPCHGWFIGERELQLPEVRLLIDAVRAAGFITAKKTGELTQKLKRFCSSYQAEDIDGQVYVNSQRKTDNEEIYYNIDKLHKAIADGKKVTLRYYTHSSPDDVAQRREYKTFTLSPYAMLWNNDHYYLVANNEKYDNLMHARLDRIKKVQELDAPSRHFSEVCDYTDYFDVADYAAKSFNMFGGEPITITVKAANSLLDVMYDKFGNDIDITKDGDSHFIFTAKVHESVGLISWIMEFEDLELLAPENLRRKIYERCCRLADKYGDQAKTRE